MHKPLNNSLRSKSMLELDENLSYRLSMLGFGVSKLISEIHAAEGLTTQQWKVISVVCHHAPIRAADIEPLVTLDKSAISRNLQSLESLQLVTRKPSTVDARAVDVAPTRKGRSLHLRVARQVMQVQAELMGGLPASEVERFFEVLGHLGERLRLRAP